MTSLRAVAQEMGLSLLVSARTMAQKTNTASPISLNKVVASHYIDRKYNQVEGFDFGQICSEGIAKGKGNRR